MTDILSQTDESANPERLAALLALPTQDNWLGLGSQVYGLLIGLLNFVAGTGIIIREVHPTLGGVNEESVYSALRAHCVECLSFSQRPELLAHAERRLPGRIVPIVLGQEVWGKDERDDAEDLRSKLEAACCLAGLDAYTDLLAKPYRAAGDAILFIAERTAERMRERWETEDARDRAEGEVALIEEEWSPLPPAPLPSSSPLLLESGPVQTDEVLASGFAPSLPVAEPAEPLRPQSEIQPPRFPRTRMTMKEAESALDAYVRAYRADPAKWDGLPGYLRSINTKTSTWRYWTRTAWGVKTNWTEMHAKSCARVDAERASDR